MSVQSWVFSRMRVWARLPPVLGGKARLRSPREPRRLGPEDEAPVPGRRAEAVAR
jgi:hypothetical protein